MHVLADVAIGEVAQFLDVFSSEGLAKRREHGCRGSGSSAPPRHGGDSGWLQTRASAEAHTRRG
jgi:hypothetical protein